MITVLDAKKIIEENCQQLSTKLINASSSLGCVIADKIISPINVPQFNNSSMDGYAFFYEKNRLNYTVVANIQAGEENTPSIKKGEAVRIFTGAPMPKGANTVIQQELVSVKKNKICFDNDSVKKGNNVRLQGMQCKKNDEIIAKNTLVTPGVIALLSSVGISKFNVYCKPKVHLIITGNELTNPGNTLKKGKIYNSNQFALLAYLETLGIFDTETFHVKDNYNELKQQIKNSLSNSDVLLISGGISVGDYDFVYPILNEEKVNPLFYKVKQKPGKPLFVGKKENKFIFALPGNPSSALSCFNQYVKPALQFMFGMQNSFSPSAHLPLAHSYTKKTNLSTILKAEIKNGQISILTGQDSFNLLPFSQVNSFVLLYENDMQKNKGDMVEVYYW